MILILILGVVNVPIYKYEIQGNLFRPWPEGEEITLINCLFKPGISDRDFIVETEVEADDENQARILGKENCFDAVSLLEFLIGEQANLNVNKEVISKKRDVIKDGSINIPSNVTVTHKSPITKEQLKEIEKVHNVLNNEGEEEFILTRSVHWWALGKKESDHINRFIKLWIALEVLIDGRGKKLVKKVRGALKEVYPSIEEEKISQLVRRVYNRRGDIVHRGFRESNLVLEDNKKLEAILDDIFSVRLKLKFKGSTLKYLN